ncbi:MAG: hypothetical protein AAF733_00030 [Verrucomicrobiota bacterium]
MKVHPVIILLVAGWLFAPTPGSAQLIQKQIVDPYGKGGTTGIVFQGSRNMRDLGKRRSTTSTVIVPSLTPVTVIPALQNEELVPKPRFGYGSDFQPAATSQSSPTPALTAPQIQGAAAPVYQFRYSYPVYRDYWISRPYRSFSCSPFRSSYRYGGWNYGGWSSWGFGRLSLSFGW